MLSLTMPRRRVVCASVSEGVSAAHIFVIECNLSAARQHAQEYVKCAPEFVSGLAPTHRPSSLFESPEKHALRMFHTLKLRSSP
jgi:hypothetical protein